MKEGLFFNSRRDFSSSEARWNAAERAAERTIEKAASDEAAFGRTGSVDA